MRSQITINSVKKTEITQWWFFYPIVLHTIGYHSNIWASCFFLDRPILYMYSWRFCCRMQAQVHDAGHAAISGPTDPWKSLNSVVTNRSWLREDLLLKQVKFLSLLSLSLTLSHFRCIATLRRFCRLRGTIWYDDNYDTKITQSLLCENLIMIMMMSSIWWWCALAYLFTPGRLLFVIWMVGWVSVGLGLGRWNGPMDNSDLARLSEQTLHRISRHS